jgi:hypothetical protein
LTHFGKHPIGFVGPQARVPEGIGGQPDIMILNSTTRHDGFAIELKTLKGNGELSANQYIVLQNLSQNLKFQTLVSNDYDEIVIALTNYYNDLMFPCTHCSKVLKSRKTLYANVRVFKV